MVGKGKKRNTLAEPNKNICIEEIVTPSPIPRKGPGPVTDHDLKWTNIVQKWRNVAMPPKSCILLLQLLKARQTNRKLPLTCIFCSSMASSDMEY